MNAVALWAQGPLDKGADRRPAEENFPSKMTAGPVHEGRALVHRIVVPLPQNQQPSASSVNEKRTLPAQIMVRSSPQDEEPQERPDNKACSPSPQR